MRGKLISFLFICVSLLAIETANAQEFRLIMELVVTEDGKKLPGAEIQVYRNGSKVETVLTDSKGRADIPMGPNGVYDISITGKGMIKKKLNINTGNVPPEDLKGDTYFPAEVDIFPKLDGMDLAILSKPIGKIVYDPKINGFDADLKYTQGMKSQLDKLKSDYEKKKAEEEKALANKQKEYDAAIKLADKAFASEDWEAAEVEYKRAAAILPIETYPSFQLAELESKLIAIRATNEKYNQAIKIADEAYASKDYPRAINEYKKASGYKPDEEYPKTKLKEVEGIAAAALKADQTYLAAIEKGDNALKINDLNTAKTAFESAAQAKPEETYPKNKLAEINDILGKQEQKEQDYQAAIKVGDEAMAAEDYAAAKASYQKALGVKPTESYPQEQITKAEGLLAASIKKDQDYLAAIESGDNALTANQLDEAKVAFQTANKIKPKEEYPINKLKEIADQKAKLAEADKAYTDKISAADKALAEKNYESAKTNYEEASNLKPTEAYPKEKINEIAAILAAAKEADSKYQAAIAKGDAAFDANKLEEAKVAYNEALTIKAEESYPKEKLTEIEGALIALEKQNSAYNDAVAKGDEALAAKDYAAAKGFYASASEAKPAEAYPKDKMVEIDGIVAANEEKERNYAAAIEAADNSFKAKSFEQAKVDYNKALAIKPDESYPKEQIGAIENQLAASEKLNADYAAAVKEGDAAFGDKNYEQAKNYYNEALKLKAEESYPKEKITEIDGLVEQMAQTEKAYEEAISKADGLLAKESYEDAKAAYMEAIALKEEEYPKSKVTEIDAKLAELAAAKEAEQKLEADYAAAMQEGNNKMEAKNLEEAIAAFTTAATLKPESPEPKAKIEEIKGLQEALAAEKAEEERLAKLQADYDSKIKQADESFSANNLEQARSEYQSALTLMPEEAYPQSKIEEINGVLADAQKQDEVYAEAITEADKLFSDEKFEDAKAKYAEASTIKSEESYPKDKIKEIDGKLASIAAAAAAIALENEKKEKLDENYNALIEEGNSLMASKEWANAKSKFEEALTLKEEQLPKDKLAEIDKAIEEEKASMAQAEIDEKYNLELKKADDFFASSNWADSKNAYQAAISIKDEQYPKDQIEIINDKITEEQSKLAAETAAAEAAKIDAEYQAAIAAADELFEANSFDEATAKYNEAIAIKEEQYPKDQLAAIESKKSELESTAEAEAREKEAARIDAEYQAAIVAADGLFASNSLDEAKVKYEEAIAIKDEQYPKDQIAAIEAKKIELASAAAAEANAKEAARIDAEYQSLIAQADLLLGEENLEEAKSTYAKALELKEEAYPRNQIVKIDNQLESIALKQQEAEESARLDADYQAAIASGDMALSTKDYVKAKSEFQKALRLKAEEEYPATKIQEIDNLLAQLSAENAALEEKYQGLIATADMAMENKDYENAKGAYREASAAKPNEAYPKDQIALIDKTIANAAAQAEQIRLQKEREAQNEAAYQTAIVEGDQFYSNKEYSSAINKYELAKGLSPSKNYPQKQIDKINNLLLSQEQAKIDAENKKKEMADREVRYKEVIALGDEAFDNKTYNMAKRQYEAALAMKPNEEYPKVRIKTINGYLEEKRLAELAEKQAQEKPIEIQKGPKSSITDDAEAELDKMYKEMWANKNSKKNEIVVSQQEEVNKYRIEEKEEDESKIQEEKLRIEGIAISLREQNQSADEFHMQNYETVKQKQADVKDNIENLNRDSERKRSDYLIEEKYTEELEYHQEHQKSQREESEQENELLEQKQSDILEQNQSLAASNLHKNTESVQQVQEDLKEVQEDLNEASENKRQSELETIKVKRDDLREFAQESNTNYEEMYTEVLVKQEAVVEGEKELVKESDVKIMDNQSKINDIATELRSSNQSANEMYGENYIAVVEKTKMLKDEQDQLNAESEKKRQDNKDREFYEGEKQIRQDPESANFPQGVSEDIIENTNSTTIRRTKVVGTQTDVYEKTLYAYGNIVYTKNGNNITKETWDAESKE